MKRLLWTSSRRYLTRHPWLMGLSVLGVALGVAVVVGIDLANTSAERAFELSAERLTGKATHQIVGAGGGLDEDAYRRVRLEADYRRSAPVVADYVRVPRAGRPFQLLGVDPFAEGPFRPYVGGGAAGDTSGVPRGAFMTQQGAALMAASAARTLGLDTGDTLRVGVEGTRRTLRIVGLLQPRDERTRRATQNLIVTDIATAQEVLGVQGRLTRVDLILPGGAAEAEARERIERALPAGAEVRRSETRTRVVEQMTRAFSLNLSALSLLALVVGLFLIYNTMTFSVVQRRPLLGRLRALGVTRREVFALVLGEAALIGLVGTAAGLALGVGMAQGLVRLVTRAINDLYFTVSVEEVRVAPLVLLKGAALGMGATLAAAFLPAREAARAQVSVVLQRSQAEGAARTLAPRLAGAGALVGLVAGGLLLVPGERIWVGYAALFCVLLSAALLVPAAVVGLAHGLRPLMGRLFGVLGKMAARGLRDSLSRTGIAVAALMVAVAATVGVGVMTQSFRQTVNAWLSYSLQSDVYVQPPSLVFRRSTATLRPGVADTLAQVPGVAGAHTVRRVEVSASATEGPTQLVAIAPGPETADTYRFKAGDPEQVWPQFQEENVVIVSEPYSYRTGIGVGDTLRLQTDRGRRPFRVGAVFFDYASDQGVVTMSRTVYDRFYDDRRVSGIALRAVAGLGADTLAARVRRAVPPGQELIVQSSRGLREASLTIFDRTFAITNVLRLLAVGVAFVGVLSALMALELERAREVAVMRAGGMTPGQVGGYVTLQTSLMGLVAGLLAVPLGLVLAYVLIFVINKRSFGWTLQLEVPPGILLQAVGLALVAALLAGAYPAWKMARANPAEAMREG